MEEGFPGYLCLTDLLDQDLSAYEFFQTLSPAEQSALRRYDSGIATFAGAAGSRGPPAGGRRTGDVSFSAGPGLPCHRADQAARLRTGFLDRQSM